MEEYSVRPLEEKDLRLVLDWRNSERVHSKMLTDHKITWEEHLAWFQRSKDNPVKRNLVFCYQDRPIGYIGYTEYDDVNMICSPGPYLGETDVPIDAGITLFYIAVEYAFAELHMKSLETSVFKSNKQAMRIDKFLGYKMMVHPLCCFLLCTPSHLLKECLYMVLPRRELILRCNPLARRLPRENDA